MNVVGVKFRNGDNSYSAKTYYYFCTFSVEVGDKVAVPVSTSYELQVATVFEASAPDKEKLATKFLVDKIDTSKYLEDVKKYELLNSKKKELEKRLKEFQKEEIFRLYAEKDPEFNKLYSEYVNLKDSM